MVRSGQKLHQQRDQKMHRVLLLAIVQLRKTMNHVHDVQLLRGHLFQCIRGLKVRLQLIRNVLRCHVLWPREGGRGDAHGGQL